MTTRAAGIALALMTAAISGSAVFLNGYAVKHFDDATVYTTAKNGIAALFLLLLAVPSGTAAAPRSWRGRLALLAVGVIGGSVPFVLFFEGLAHASATQAAFIHKTLVVWVALLAVPLLHERIGPAHVAAIGLLLAGQAVLVGEAGTVAFGTGELMILAATLLWAVEVVLVKSLLGSIASPVLAAARMVLGAGLLLVYVGLSGRVGDLAALGAGQWAWVVATGLVLTGYVATWYAALARAEAVDVTAVLVLGALVTGLLDEGVKDVPVDALGLALIAAGVALVAGRALRPSPTPA